MPLILNNEEQSRLISPEEAIDAWESALRQLARGDATRRPRIDVYCPTRRPEEFLCFSSMEGVIREPGYYALRIKPDVMAWPVIDGTRRTVTYNVRPGSYGGLVLLFSVDNAELLGILNDGYIQHLRVAVTAALGVRYLARPNAGVLGMIGSGGMARSFAELFRVVRDVRTVKAFSPNRAHLEAYCREMADQLGCEVVPAPSARAVVEGTDIVATCTNAIEPVLFGDWIEPGAHVANVTPWELDKTAYARIDVAGLLSRRRPMEVSGFADDDFAIRKGVMSYAAGQPDERSRIPHSGTKTPAERYPNARYVDCVDWATGTPYARAQDDEVTTLAHASRGTREGEAEASAGLQGLQFASIAGKMYERACEKGLGTKIPREFFLQTIRT